MLLSLNIPDLATSTLETMKKIVGDLTETGRATMQVGKGSAMLTEKMWSESAYNLDIWQHLDIRLGNSCLQ